MATSGRSESKGESEEPWEQGGWRRECVGHGSGEHTGRPSGLMEMASNPRLSAGKGLRRF